MCSMNEWMNDLFQDNNILLNFRDYILPPHHCQKEVSLFPLYPVYFGPIRHNILDLDSYAVIVLITITIIIVKNIRTFMLFIKQYKWTPVGTLLQDPLKHPEFVFIQSLQI